MTEEKKHSIKDKEKIGIDAQFVNSEEPKEKIKNVSFPQMFRYASTYDKFLMVVGLISATGTGVLQPLNTILFGSLTGDIIAYATSIQINLPADQKKIAEDNFFDGIRYFALMNSLIGIGMFVFSYLATVTFNYSAMRQIFKIRSAYLKSILNQDVGWYDINQTGDFASRMSDDLFKFEDGIGEKVPVFWSFQVVFLTSLIIALVKGWELALICLTSLPATLITIGIVGLLTTKLAKNELEAYGAAGSIAEEALSLIRTITAFGGQKKEVDRYNKNLVEAKNNNIRRSMFSALGFGLLWFMIYASYALAFWYGVKLVLRDRTATNQIYTPSNMVTVFFSVMTGSMNFGIASPYIEAFGISKAAASKIFSVIDHKPTINLSKGNGKTLNVLIGNIQFKDVAFRYPSRKDVPILKGLSLNIKSGDTVALVGSSGCGKSTVIQLLQRLYDADSGEVTIDGKNIKEYDLTWLRSQIGVVGQEPILFGTSILENIRYGKDGVTEEDVIQAAKKANAHNFIKALPNGYNTLVGEKGAQLSGGQKQRIAIARALVRNPTLLLLDEATSALDNTSEAKVQAALDAASVECTTIIVAHRLSTIRGANKIIVLSQGVVVEEGTHEELMELKQEYYRLVTAQVKSSEQFEVAEKKKVVRAISLAESSTGSDHNIEATKEDNEDDFNENKDVSVFEILKMNAPEWPYILFAGLGSIVVGCGMPVFAVLFGSILGTLANGDPDFVRSETNKYCLYFVLGGLITMVSVFTQMYLLGIAGEKMTERVRSRLFKAMIYQEIGFFDKKTNGVGALCAKLSSDASNIQGATGIRVGTILQSIATFCLAIGLSMYYEWKLGLVTAAFTPVILIAMFFERRNTRGGNDSRDSALQKSTRTAVEAVGNIRTVASLGLEEKFQQLYESELMPHYKSSLKTVHWRAIVFGLSRSLLFFAYATAMYYGGFLIRDGLPYDRVFKVSQAQIMGTVSIANSLAFSPNFAKGVAAAKKVKSFLSRIPLIRDLPSSRQMVKASGNFSFSEIEFTYPTRPNVLILKGLNLDILNGKTVALVGESGCGKSTIIQLIERFYDPRSGEVKMDGVDLKDISLDSLRSHMGIVSQEPNLFNKSIAENIAYGDNSREVSMDEIIKAAKNANIHNFITGLPKGYETKLGEKAVQLSGGQKQRIAIARALVRNPKVLLLDEATSALDTESEKVVQEALDQAKKGRTCVTIAHRLTTIQDADLICVVANGVIAESGSHQELLQKEGLYYKLYTQKT
ncbi:ATP-dependent translocase ABCB1-like isoform X1 [Diabrotica virgifera virgifera]|uniref:Multidrug resistance protein 1A-like n=1 Tax=Diabrotica virgifera virgifera TaxID=50390 RepID=A0ABM5KWT5_DIAVI|nr:ATP-dependent translocase ABCB1-like isoform X1 [Diabrotica virgifera virgifera]XP_050514649.1 ATP-dependent translocase ABCB1-like isoform X1 [Diabrotica virgifera virgifera]XP_050514650.1 ATP-dependent translocase ABCB1-like isoform X1 [Diabrotica virgifera virgifera]